MSFHIRQRVLLVGFIVMVGWIGMEAAFTWLIPVDQAPAMQWDAELGRLRHAPNQSGVRYPDGDKQHPVRYTINAQGENAPEDYWPVDSHTHHVAVVGDSFVEALQVQPVQSMGRRLQVYLGPAWSVQSFGMSGAPMSEDLHTARVIIQKYHPDLVVVVLVHNDFTESFDPPSNALYASFERIDAHTLQAIPATPYRQSLGTRIMADGWALGRAAVLSERSIRAGLHDLWFDYRHAPPKMGTDVVELQTHWAETQRVTQELFRQFAQLQVTTHTPIVFVMDGPREIRELQEVAGRELEAPSQSPVYPLNALAEHWAAYYHLPLLDLTGVFSTDFQQHGQRFDFPQDYHWNAYAHDLVAHELRAALPGWGLVDVPAK